MTTIKQRKTTEASSNRPAQHNDNQQDTSPQPLTHTTQLAPPSIFITLIGFSIAMLVLPLGTYFLTVDRLFTGNATFAGALAALMANLVLVAYVYLAWREDQVEQQQRQQRQQQRLAAQTKTISSSNGIGSSSSDDDKVK